MPPRRAYQDPETHRKLLDALRRGMTRAEAAQAIGGKATTLAHWIDNDDVLRLEVEAAEREAQATGTAKTAKAARDPQTGGDRWAKIRGEAERHGGGMLGYWRAVEARVVAVPGNVGASPFWRYVAHGFYSGGYRELCVIAGRGAGKSTIQILFAATELLFRDRTVPGNDPEWIWPFMSHNMAESGQRFGPFKSTLEALGFGEADLVTHRVNNGRSDIAFHDAKGNRVKVNIYPNTKDATRGGNLAGATHDEELHWQADADKGLSRADDVLEVEVNAFRGDRSRVQIRISSANEAGGAMMDAAIGGSTSLRYVPTLGPFLNAALDGFARVADHLNRMGLPDGAKRVRAWAATLTESSPWIPTWVGNPSHDPVSGFEILWDLLRPNQDRVGIWLRENGSCTLPVGASGAIFEHDVIERAREAMLYPGRGERFAAIDTGASKNPAALAIVERVAHAGRYQWRPLLLRQWKRKRDALPLDLRGAVLPEMADIILAFGCIPAWWSDGWASHDIERVAAEKGLTTIFVSTSTAMADIVTPFGSALRLARGDAVALSGCENIDEAVAQLRQVRESASGGVVWPKAGDEHGELAQVLLRAMAHAGIAALAGAEVAPTAAFRGFDDRYSALRRGGR